MDTPPCSLCMSVRKLGERLFKEEVEKQRGGLDLARQRDGSLGLPAIVVRKGDSREIDQPQQDWGQ